MVSDSTLASACVSMRNQVLPPGASQTYFMRPPPLSQQGWRGSRRKASVSCQLARDSETAELQVYTAYNQLAALIAGTSVFRQATGRSTLRISLLHCGSTAQASVRTSRMRLAKSRWP